jgi:hypothetical protein
LDNYPSDNSKVAAGKDQKLRKVSGKEAMKRTAPEESKIGMTPDGNCTNYP